MNDTISMEHQLRYETARANLYAETLKRVLAAVTALAGDAKAIMESQMELLNHDWRKVSDAGLITTKGETK